MAGMTGREMLQSIVDGKVPQPPIGFSLGFALRGVDHGFARFEGTADEYQYNPMGVVHGGWACTLLDSCMSCAVLATLDATLSYTTAQINVHMVRPITRDTGLVIAEGRVVHAGRTIGTAEGRLTDASGKLLAHGTTTCAIFPRR
jgi:uncharacterized protein (TIGR00369 family)